MSWRSGASSRRPLGRCYRTNAQDRTTWLVPEGEKNAKMNEGMLWKNEMEWDANGIKIKICASLCGLDGWMDRWRRRKERKKERMKRREKRKEGDKETGRRRGRTRKGTRKGTSKRTQTMLYCASQSTVHDTRKHKNKKKRKRLRSKKFRSGSVCHSLAQFMSCLSVACPCLACQ